MSENKSSIFEMLKPTLVLGLITLVVSGLLVFTYNVTGVGEAGPAVSEEILAGAAEVLPGGEGFEDAMAGANDNVLAIVKTSNDAGYVINAKGKGYGGDLAVLVGFDMDGKITGIKVMESAETPGIGTKVTEDQAVLDSYIGQTTATGDVVGGATFSSNALNEAVTAAADAFAVVSTGGTLDGSTAPSTSEEGSTETDSEKPEEEKEEVTIDTVIGSAPEVLAGGEGFEEVEVATNENVKFAIKASNGAGYVINVVSEGFGGEMNLIVGFNNTKAITGIKALSMKETEGLGTKVLDAEVVDTLIGKTELDEEVAVSGATVSSGALNTAIKAAFEAVNSIKDLSSADAIIEVAANVLSNGEGFADLQVEATENIK